MESPQSTKLTLEQQMSIAAFRLETESMPREQLLELARATYTALQQQKAGYLELLKHQWNLDDKPYTRQPT